MAGNQLDNLQLLEGGLLRSQESTDVIQQSANWEFQADVSIAGNLVAQNVVALQTEELRVEDNHIFLNDGYTTVAAQTAGLVANYLPTSTTDTVATGGFTAGVPATSNPTVITTGSGTFSAGDFLLISGANDDENDGLYECLSHSGTTLTIRGIGTTATVEDFTEDQFVTDTTVAGTITKINVSVIRCGTDGTWEVASGGTTGLSFADLGTGGADTLQTAYVAGNTITTDSGNGDVVITGTEQLLVTATNGVDIDTQFDFDGTVFDVLMSSGGFSIDGAAASNVSVTSGNLTLSTITSGTLELTSAGLVDLNAAANLDIDVTGTFDMLSTGAFSIDGTGASNVSADTGNLTLSTTTSGNVVVNAAGDVDVDGTNIDLLASSGFSVDGGAASNVSTTAAGLTLSTITSGTLEVTSAGLLDINAAANIDVDVTGTFDVLATGAVSIDGTGASNVTADSGNLTLSTTTSGGVLITSAAASTYTVPNATAAAWTLTDGTDTYAVVDSVDNVLELPQPVIATGGIGIQLTTDDALVEGDVVCVQPTTGNVALADADTGNLYDGWAVAISSGTFSATSTATLLSVPGTLIPVRFSAAPAAANNGDPVYLSSTAGLGTLTAPSGASTVTFVIGILQGANGADTTPAVLFQPQFISKGASVT